jgi:Plasmid pRiA4b ORF-3-like protein
LQKFSRSFSAKADADFCGVGGVRGYADFLQAIQDKSHEEREEMFEWVDGWFDAEEFDPVTATKSMKKGLPDWRRME